MKIINFSKLIFIQQAGLGKDVKQTKLVQVQNPLEHKNCIGIYTKDVIHTKKLESVK